jgi:hypothetical protein
MELFVIYMFEIAQPPQDEVVIINHGESMAPISSFSKALFNKKKYFWF